MSNKQQLITVFQQSLRLADGSFDEQLTYNTIPEWDSTGHMALIVGIEKAFDVMLDMDDIIDMSSFSKAQEILSKYDVEFSD